MVVASAGNGGPLCGTVDDPIAIYDATFSVGAHSSNGAIASFSSRGAVTVDGSGRRKPDISAPGVSVRSAWVNKTFNTISGTSMASPHVAGAVALLWSAVPDLVGEIDLTEQVLIKSATPVPLNQCGEGGTPVAPNNTYGFGRLDVLAAVQMAQQPGAMTLTISDTVTVSVTVVLIDNLTGYQYRTVTGNDGIARFPRLYAGSYRATLGGVSADPSPIPLVANEQKQVTIQRGNPTDIDEQPEPLRRQFLPFIVQ
jgi:subtilisin family serine protease